MDDIAPLRKIAGARQAVQKLRISVGNQLAAIEDGRAEATPSTVDWLQERELELQNREDQLSKEMAEASKGIPIVEQAIRISGVGRVNLTRALVLIDIEKADTVSALWKYAGYGVTNGKGDRLRRGQKAGFSVPLKGALYSLASGLMRAKGKYYQEYLQAKRYYQRNRDWDKGHVDAAARRKMIKLWLSHLWEAWREDRGLPTRPPYILEHSEHTTFKEKIDYGWIAIEEAADV